MSDRIIIVEYSGNGSVSNNSSNSNGSVYETFSLKSSQIQPFDSDRMSGRPTINNDKHDTDSVSGSDK